MAVLLWLPGKYDWAGPPTELGDIVEQVSATEKVPFKFDYSMDANGHPQNIYCRSDHASRRICIGLTPKFSCERF